MLKSAIDYCQQNNIQSIHVESTLTAKEFYVKHGFGVLDEVAENCEVVAFNMMRTV